MPERTADHHAEKPLSIRLGDLRQRVEDYARLHGLPVRRVIVTAVREKLDREEAAAGAHAYVQRERGDPEYGCAVCGRARHAEEVSP